MLYLPRIAKQDPINCTLKPPSEGDECSLNALSAYEHRLDKMAICYAKQGYTAAMRRQNGMMGKRGVEREGRKGCGIGTVGARQALLEPIIS